MTARVQVLLGTKKGAFILEGDQSRTNWHLRGPFCEAWPIHHLNVNAATGTLYAASGNPWFGPSVWRSDDNAQTWTQSGAGLTYGDAGPTIDTMWHVTAAHGVLYAGAAPAGLFRSTDDGTTWEHVSGLRAHPSSAAWQPGYGGLCLHSIVPDPAAPEHLWIAISSVGTFYSDDAGATWTPRNQGVRAEFSPDRYPEFGQCVHKLLLASDGTTLYQQNHCGVYRSTDAGLHWQEITAGLPSDFGFPLAVHPHDPQTLYTIPLNGADKGRYVPDGRMVVWRSQDGGDTWTPMTHGLPAENAYLGVLREAMAVDQMDQAGIYFGTSTGQIFGSNDAGENWQELCNNLPPIWSVETMLVEG